MTAAYIDALRAHGAALREALDASQALVHTHELGVTPHPTRRTALDLALDHVVHTSVEVERLERAEEQAA